MIGHEQVDLRQRDQELSRSGIFGPALTPDITLRQWAVESQDEQITVKQR
jgi:hypothetical protein